MGGLCLAMALVAPMPMPDIVAADVNRFPPTKELAFAYYTFASNHVAWLAKNEPQAWDWQADAEYCRRAWDLLDDCKRVYSVDSPNLILALCRLRAHIGPAMFYAGQMPPPVPLNWFRTID